MAVITNLKPRESGADAKKKPESSSKSVAVHHGDCLDVLRSLQDASVDSVVTDPPYGLSREPDVAEVLSRWLAGDDYHHRGSGFMGKSWDSFVPGPVVWREVLRVLKPGGHALVFAGARTVDLMGMSLRLAGFEIRDQISWVYSQGFPKSRDLHDVDERIARGVGTALKPAQEPIIVARKPISTTSVAANVVAWGTGGFNIDACRVPFESEEDRRETVAKNRHEDFGTKPGGNNVYGDYSMVPRKNYQPTGRFPANLIHDGSPAVVALFDVARGVDRAKDSIEISGAIDGANTEGSGPRLTLGSAARFFRSCPIDRDEAMPLVYCPKPSRKEKDAGCEAAGGGSAVGDEATGTEAGDQISVQPRRNTHPTVKPVSLMRYLCALATPPNGLVLDPFAGSGTTGVAAIAEGFRFLGVERDDQYVEIARARVEHALDTALAASADAADRSPESPGAFIAQAASREHAA